MARVDADTLIRARTLRRRLTNAETILWSRLRHGVGGMRFRRQHPIGPFVADFACLRARPNLWPGSTGPCEPPRWDAAMSQEFFVYILSSKRNRTLYVGVTNSLVRRV
jgi:hypothetical protein